MDETEDNVVTEDTLLEWQLSAIVDEHQKEAQGVDVVKLFSETPYHDDTPPESPLDLSAYKAHLERNKCIEIKACSSKNQEYTSATYHEESGYWVHENVSSSSAEENEEKVRYKFYFILNSRSNAVN